MILAAVVYLVCTGTMWVVGYHPVPYTETITITDYSVNGKTVGGDIWKRDEKTISFRTAPVVEQTNDAWKSSQRSDICVTGSIDRLTGEMNVGTWYGKCPALGGQLQPPAGLQLLQSLNLKCTPTTGKLF
jgi:hypothetical protein